MERPADLPSVLPIYDPAVLYDNPVTALALCHTMGYQQVVLRLRHLPIPRQQAWMHAWPRNSEVQAWWNVNDALYDRKPRFWHKPEKGPVPHGTFGTSVHSLQAATRARNQRAAYALVSPVRPTATHPGRSPMPDTMQQAILSELSAGRIPAYALGGVGPQDVVAWQELGFAGVAGIRAFWETAATTS